MRGPTQESKVSTFDGAIQKFLKKYSESNRCRSFTRSWNSPFVSHSWNIFLTHSCFIFLFLLSLPHFIKIKRIIFLHKASLKAAIFVHNCICAENGNQIHISALVHVHIMLTPVCEWKPAFRTVLDFMCIRYARPSTFYKQRFMLLINLSQAPP